MSQLIGLYAFMLSPALVPVIVHMCGAAADAVNARKRRRKPVRPTARPLPAQAHAPRPGHRTPARAESASGPRHRRPAADPAA